MNAPPFPLNPTVGQISGGYVWSGSTWVPNTAAGGLSINVQTFKASGTYMPTPGLVSCVVECLAGGGGGGSAGPTTSVQYIFGGGGGGSGGFSRKAVPAALVLGGVIVTVGAGGAGGVGTGGGLGGDTSFGALCVAKGGGGGYNAAVGGSGQGGFGGGFVGGVGDLVLPGASGSPGSLEFVSSPLSWLPGYGAQGGTIFGGNAPADVVAPGQTAVGHVVYNNTGSGGTGGCINQFVDAGVVAGGAGSSGLCIVTEYVSGSGSDGCAPIPITDGSCLGWGGSWR